MRELLKTLQNRLKAYTREYQQEKNRDMEIWLAGYCRALNEFINEIQFELKSPNNDETKEQGE